MISNIPEVKVSYSFKAKLSELPKISSSYDAYNEFWNIVDQDTIGHVESSYMLLLNNNNKVLGWKLLSVGGCSGTVVDPKVVFQTALKCNAKAIILCHNHPSGNLNPSSEDKSMSRKIKEGGELLCISLLDHIIIVPDHGQYTSMADESHF